MQFSFMGSIPWQNVIFLFRTQMLITHYGILLQKLRNRLWKKSGNKWWTWSSSLLKPNETTNHICSRFWARCQSKSSSNYLNVTCAIAKLFSKNNFLDVYDIWIQINFIVVNKSTFWVNWVILPAWYVLVSRIKSNSLSFNLFFYFLQKQKVIHIRQTRDGRRGKGRHCLLTIKRKFEMREHTH